METMDIDSFRVRAQFTGMFDLSKAEEYVIKEAEKKGLIVLDINFQCFE